MIEIDKFIKKEKLKSFLIMQVHDELVFDIYPGEEEIVGKKTKEIMEGVLKDKPIILKADVGIGNNWREAK